MDGGGIIRAVMSFSGGMDSTSLLLRLINEGYKIDCISFNYGQKHKIEIDRASLNISYLRNNGYDIEHKIVDLTSAMSIFHSSLIRDDLTVPEGHYEEGQMKSTVVPNRNAIFSSIIYGYALSIVAKEDVNVKVALGVHSGDHEIYPDCRPDFYQSLDESFKLGNWDSERIDFYLPYINGDKISILKDAIESCEKINISFDEVFSNTITSYNPDSEGRSSGKTGSDIERILAFNKIGRRDPIEYTEPWETVLHHAIKVENEFKDNLYKENLTDIQYNVTRKSATERPFTGEYWDEKRDGDYFCICCGHKLFTSDMKYNSGCGWPSFFAESVDADILQIEDRSHGMYRIEVKCSKCDSHLGHIFDDGPIQKGGKRYCINSASMHFKEE